MSAPLANRSTCRSLRLSQKIKHGRLPIAVANRATSPRSSTLTSAAPGGPSQSGQPPRLRPNLAFAVSRTAAPATSSRTLTVTPRRCAASAMSLAIVHIGYPFYRDSPNGREVVGALRSGSTLSAPWSRSCWSCTRDGRRPMNPPALPPSCEIHSSAVRAYATFVRFSTYKVCTASPIGPRSSKIHARVRPPPPLARNVFARIANQSPCGGRHSDTVRFTGTNR